MDQNISISIEPGTSIFITALTLLFVAGKIFGFLHWSWLWVFVPIWGPLALIIIIAAFIILAAKAANYYS